MMMMMMTRAITLQRLDNSNGASKWSQVGARTEMPGCSLCMGNQARVADKSTVVSTSTRNFPNRLLDTSIGRLVFPFLHRPCAVA